MEHVEVLHSDRGEHVRKMLVGWCLIAAPIVLLAGTLLHPDQDDDGGALAREIREGEERWYWSHLLIVAGLALLVGAVVGLAHMLRRRAPTLATVAGGVAIAGIVVNAALIGAEGIGGWFMNERGDEATTAAVLDEMLDSGRMLPFVIPPVIGMLAGIALGYGLYRTRVAANWAAGATMLGFAVLIVAVFVMEWPLYVAATALLVIGLGSIGYDVLAETDDEWEITPEFHGFRHVHPTPTAPV